LQGVLDLQTVSGVVRGQVITVWRGTSLETLSNVGHVVDGRLLINVLPGEQLQIAVDSTSLNTGQFGFTLRLHGIPPHDQLAHAQQLEGTNITFQCNNLAATLEEGEVKPAFDSAGKTIWFSWVAPTTGRVTLIAPFFLRAAVFSDTDGNNLTRIETPPNTDFAFLGTAGGIYHFQLDTIPEAVGDFTVTLHFTTFGIPTNDDFENAIALESQYVEAWGALHGATAELGEPAHLDGVPFKSVWWLWQAPFDGDFSWRTEGSLNRDVMLAFYQGPAVEALTLVHKGTGFIRLYGKGGETYAIAAVLPIGVEGDVYLRLTGGVPGAPSTLPGNILRNPSFEEPGDLLAYWGLEPQRYMGYSYQPGGAHGGSWVAIPADVELYQDIETTPGHTYQIRLATFGQVANAWTETEVSFGGEVVGRLAYETSVSTYWHWATFTAVAQSSVSRLSIRNLSNYTGIDGVSVVSLDEPPTIITPPTSMSAYAGSSVNLLVGAVGPSPLHYQWLHNAQPITGATNKLLVLSGIEAGHEGEYRVQVRNFNGEVTSPPAVLTVIEVEAPEIILQPWGDAVVAGEYHVLTVVAEGAPISYQWLKDGNPLSGATNRVLVFPAIAMSDAGAYKVEVRNPKGTVLSREALVQVSATGEPGVLIWLANWTPEPGVGPDFVIYDADQITLLTGSQFVAQLYAGLTPDRLRPCGQPAGFLEGTLAGRISPAPILVPNISPGSEAYAQVRVWEAQYGASYEEARARGGRFGRSDVLRLTNVPGSPAAAFLDGLPSFSLRSGLPDFYVGRIEIAERHADGRIEWRLVGQTGFRYLVEKSAGDARWYPLVEIKIEEGSAYFVDSNPDSNQAIYYRARILD
jgi:hypothetical protein